MDWAKYTDEGWYGNAAIRSHLFGHWYVKGDFNTLQTVPVWNGLLWLLFAVTGVSIIAARALSVGIFCVNLLLGYFLLRRRGTKWMALLAMSMLVTSPFLYAFSRLAVVDPLVVTCMLVELHLLVRMQRWKYPVLIAALAGLLFTVMLLTKTTAIFLLPALGWALLMTLWKNWRRLAVCSVAALASFGLSMGAWLGYLIYSGLIDDFRYFFFINKYVKPENPLWPLWSFWWSFHGGLWVDFVLIPLAGAVCLLVALCWRQSWARQLGRDPLFGASLLTVGGYIFFMTYQNHPQPRYFVVVAYFGFVAAAMAIEALVASSGRFWIKRAGWAGIAVAVVAMAGNVAQMGNYVLHPEYTFVHAAEQLTAYIDHHPNGKRLLVSISGDEITMMTHLPALCDDFGTLDLATKLAIYQPGWYASWNDLDPGTLEDIHTHFWLEQVASFPALDDPERNTLVLFKLHPLSHGAVREPGEQNLQIQLPDDRFDVDVE